VSDHRPGTGPSAVLERIERATNDHDLDALAGCFTGDYESVWPVHPARTFAGVDQVRRNWERIFSSVPDVKTEIIHSVVSGDEAWSEWEFAGNRLDSEPFLMRGVIILRIRNGQAACGRFYLEPVDGSPDEVDAAVRRLAGAPVAGSGRGGRS
jgi:ketosteroid isomerase-like protein